MPTSTRLHEFEDFVLFVVSRIKEGDRTSSVEELVRQWRDGSESAATIRDLRQSIADEKAGLAAPVETAFTEIRRWLRLDE